ncbi:hypothetical protein ILUMI_14288 [Ignelater luminosus]|uniref:C2H2-type domain-containing protein n=1 Tax=Ignelater luminosus TaxID=2038154 RepID=A0A8K0G500_IGNLU|nr:hypothetical protein ILUMI_14288 [Ignelater luminosus]
MPSPRCKKDIERFIGLVTYLGRFIENLSDKTYHLRKLLKQDVIFEWNDEQETAFTSLKDFLVTKPTLKFFDPNKEITISVDASQNVCVVEQNLIISDASLNRLIEETKRDDELQKIKNYLINGWPTSINKVPSEIKPYYKIRSDITQGNNDLIYMGRRVIISKALRTKITIKKLIKKTTEKGDDFYLALLAYRNTPVNDLYTPSQLLMSRYLRDHLPINENQLESSLINAKLYSQKIESKQEKSKLYYDKKGVKNLDKLENGTVVRYQEIPKGHWNLGIIVESMNHNVYKIKKCIIRNRRYIRKTKELNNKIMHPPESLSTLVHDIDVNQSSTTNLVHDIDLNQPSTSIDVPSINVDLRSEEVSESDSAAMTEIDTRSETNVVPVENEIVNNRFANQRRSHRYRPFQCDECSKRYTSLKTLKRHQNVECGKEKQFFCKYCPRQFYYKQDLQSHTARHQRSAMQPIVISDEY